MKDKSFKTMLAGIAAGLLVPVCTANAAAAVSDSDRINLENSRAAAYSYITDTYAARSAKFTQSNLEGYFSSDPRVATYYAALSVRLYEYSADTVYLDNAKNTVNSLLEYWGENTPSKSNDFFTYGAFVEAYTALRDLGEIQEGDDTVAELVNRSATGQKGTDNQTFMRARGLLLAAKKLKANSYTDSWLDYVETTWNSFINAGYINENAAGYNGIGITAMAEIADIMGYTLPKQIIEDFMCQQAPSGAIPEYGDAYFCEWYYMIYPFRYYASRYGSGAAAYNADRLFGFGRYNYPLETSKPLLDIMNLYYVEKAYSLDCSGAAGYAPSELKSTVTYRVNLNGDTVPNKLMLRNGDAFAFAELFPEGSHGHPNRGGSLLYYEVGGVPLFHGMARHNRSAAHANACLVTDSDDSYYVTIPPDTTLTEKIPLRAITYGDTATLSKITFRLAATKETENVYIDNIRLTGKKGTLVIDSMDSLDKWKRSDSPYTLSEDWSTDGGKSIKINLVYGAGYFYNSPDYNMKINLDEYDTLVYDWKYTSSSGKMNFSFITRLYGERGDMDYYQQLVNITPVLKSAEVSENNGISSAVLTYGSYGSEGTELVRRLSLYEDGSLVICDDITTSDSGKKARQLWQLYDSAKEQDDYYAFSGEDKLWYTSGGQKLDSPAFAVKMFASGTDIWANNNVTNSAVTVKTLEQSCLLTPGEVSRLVSIIVPESGETKPLYKGDYYYTNSKNGLAHITANQSYGNGFCRVIQEDNGVYAHYLFAKQSENLYAFLAGYRDGEMISMNVIPFEGEAEIVDTVSPVMSGDSIEWKAFVIAEGLMPYLHNEKGE